jgi:NADH-quinone oxidoreductase subunit B
MPWPSRSGREAGTFKIAALRQVTRSALRPLVLDFGCCGVPALQLGAPPHDMLGTIDVDEGLWTIRPQVLIVAGRLSAHMEPIVCALHTRMAEPHLVIAYGACAISGSLFDTIPASELLPVDVWVPGCPPHPDMLERVWADLCSAE